MGFMDKVRASAEQALTVAQQGVDQAQTKVSEIQATKARDALYRDLGEAFYNQQRLGGPAEAVTAAVAALDAAPVPPAPTAEVPPPV